MGSPKVIEPHKPPKASEYFLKKFLLSSLFIKFHLFLTSPNSTVHYLFTEVSFFFVQKYLSILSPWAQPLPLFHVNFPIPFSAVLFQSFFLGTVPPFLALSCCLLHYPTITHALSLFTFLSCHPLCPLHNLSFSLPSFGKPLRQCALPQKRFSW